MKSLKKSFHIPPSYTFSSSYSNPTTVVSLAPFVSSCSSPFAYLGGLRPIYQQQKSLLPPLSSNSSSLVPIHRIDEDIFETPPSSVHSSINDLSTIHSSQILDKKDRVCKKSQGKLSNHASKSHNAHRSTSDKSKSTSGSHSKQPSISNDANLLTKNKHRLTDDIERVVQEHLQYVREDVSDGWDLIHQEGEMKVYRREVEENGIVVDPLKMIHTIQGVTGHELCRYFWEFQYRMEWETTLDSTKIIEHLDSDTVIFYQVHKRVWPAAQRDSCFWSHIRSISHSDEDQPTWLVVNYTTPHPHAPIKAPQVRLVANVALICETLIREPPLNPQDIKRENIQCKLTYVAFVNPGGWVPGAALRSVAKREYPRFLKRFTSYVMEQTRDKPILF